jgi:hypothetical protein
MVEDGGSTTAVIRQRCVADRLGNLVIEVGGRASAPLSPSPPRWSGRLYAIAEEMSVTS